MKRAVLPLALFAALAVPAAPAAEPARLNVVAFDRFDPLPRAEILVDGRPVAETNADGTAQLTLEPGERVIELRRDGAIVARYVYLAVEGDSAELIATVLPDADPAFVFESAKGQAGGAVASGAEAGPPGTLAGRVISSEDGKPIANARVFVSGTPLELRTNEAGEFEAPLAPGSYALSVIATDFAAQTLEGIAILSGETTTREIGLTPAGLELPEFVVLEPYVEGSLAAFVEEKRTSYAVAEVLGIEQISRAGDSDVAGALKRVTGLTLVDGKYVYVRGLGERYSSVLLNGAAVPSPDPSRRVVPLDLFPVEILQGVVIQKSFSAEMPGEFGGGTIQLRTKTMPEEFFFKVSVSQGYAEGTTFADGLRYRGGTQDWTGFDQVRGLPDSVIAANERFGRLLPQTPFTDGLTLAEITAISRDVAALGFATRNEKLGTNGSATIGIGDSFLLGEDWRIGYVYSLRYSQNWDNSEDVRRVFAFQGEDLPLAEFSDITRTKTDRNIDLSAFLSVGVEFGANHKLTSTSTLVRQTVDTVQIDEGFDVTSSVSRTTLLEWEENALVAQQFNGEHAFPALLDLAADWNYTRARATRATPGTREYRYELVPGTEDEFEFSTSSSSNALSFGELTDEAESVGVNLKLPLRFGERHELNVLAGVKRLDRDRDAEIRGYDFIGRLPADLPPEFRRNNLDVILAPGNIGPGLYLLRDRSSNADAYVAIQELEGAYLAFDWLWTDLIRVTVGARDESNVQEVRTFKLTDPSLVDSEASIETSDVLPSLSGTWFINPDSQLRLIYAETVSRPDFRELSTSPFTDPLIDTISIGNPDLTPAEIKNLDIRYEYYFSPVETFSVALFAKDFVSPIERIQTPATGDVVTYFNVPAATLYGIEFDLYKSLDFVDGWDWLPAWISRRVTWADIVVGANYAWIKSSVELTRETGGDSTSLERPLQGQSPYVVNFQVGWQPEDGRSEATLLYNISGRRISEVGVKRIPDVYEEPAGQLDFVFARELWPDWKLKLRARNLLDPKIEFTVGDEIKRELRRGRELVLSLEWSPD